MSLMPWTRVWSRLQKDQEVNKDLSVNDGLMFIFVFFLKYVYNRYYQKKKKLFYVEIFKQKNFIHIAFIRMRRQTWNWLL
jgi:hypothetical protein